MALNNLITLEDELLSAEGKVTSVILDETGGTITGKLNVSIYGLVFVNYNLSMNPKTPNVKSSPRPLAVPSEYASFKGGRI